jgi:hypothetical protein
MNLGGYSFLTRVALVMLLCEVKTNLVWRPRTSVCINFLTDFGEIRYMTCLQKKIV